MTIEKNRGYVVTESFDISVEVPYGLSKLKSKTFHSFRLKSFRFFNTLGILLLLKNLKRIIRSKT